MREFPQIIKTVKSGYNFEDFVEWIKKAAENNGWNVVSVLDVRENPKINVHIVGICNPKYAGGALRSPRNQMGRSDDAVQIRRCQESGGVYTYSIDMGLFASAMGDELLEIFREITDDNKKIASAVLV